MLEYQNTNFPNIHIWSLRGLVYLDESFMDIYENQIKMYGVSKLANELNVDYATIAIYRKNKPINIKFLEKICEILGIEKSYAEQCVTGFTQNLKTKYYLKFPIEITPLHLRMISMVIGDGSVGPTFNVWTQHSKNIHYGAIFIGNVIKYIPKIRVRHNENIGVVSIPKFMGEIISQKFRCENFKSTQFFEKICELPREWKFQVFAQIVVDEGSPDTEFRISQMTPEIKSGIRLLLESLDYSYTQVKNGFYIKTRSFPAIEEDFNHAINKFGNFGGFWFKDERFKKACKSVKPQNSENIEKGDMKFEKALEIIKNKKNTFNRKDLIRLTDMSMSPSFDRLNKYIKSGGIIKLNRNLYTFPEKLNKISVEWLEKTKEAKVLEVISELEAASWKDVAALSCLSQTQMHRAINNLLASKKIVRLERNLYQRQ